MNSFNSVTKTTTQMGLKPEWAFYPWFSDCWPVAVFPVPVQVAAWTYCSRDKPAVLTADQAWLTYSAFILQ